MRWCPAVDVPDLVGLFIRPLEDLEIPYMVTGGVASVVYGDPRFTRDIDVVLQLASVDVERFASAFDSGDFYVPPVEVLQEEAGRVGGGHFTVIHRDSALRADIYVVADDPLHAWGFQRRRRLPLDDFAIWLAPIEYVILRKLEYFQASGSERHLRDIALMLRISSAIVDHAALRDWIERLDLTDPWRTAESFDPA